MAKSYSIIKFVCSQSRYKKKERDLYQDKCTFYIEFLEEPDRPNVWKVNEFNKYHTHNCDKREVWDLREYFNKKESKPMRFRMTQEKPIKDWKFEFMKSLTYELTTVYADHIVTAVQDKNPSIDKQLVKRLRMERGAEHMEDQLEEYRG